MNFKLPGNDSLAWPVILIIVLTAVYATVAAVGTKNGFDVEADLKAIVALIGTVIAVGVIKRLAVGPSNSDDDKKSDK